MKAHYVLYGGGIDSSAVLLELACKQLDTGVKEPIVMVQVDYFQKACVSERDKCDFLSNSLTDRGLDIGQAYLEAPMTYSRSRLIWGNKSSKPEDDRLEMRNVILLSMTASYVATVETEMDAVIYTGFIVAESGMIKDASLRLLDQMRDITKLTKANEFDIDFEAPLLTRNMTHWDAYVHGKKLGEQIGLDFDDIIYSCYEIEECGKCRHCMQLAEYKDKFAKEN
jgi:7-cyano-7-deazaguanine synthase in queuosine biosynthesis